MDSKRMWTRATGLAKVAALSAAVVMGAMTCKCEEPPFDAFIPSDRLIAAIRTKESIDGALSGNTLQIKRIYVRDVNRVWGTSFKERDVYNRRKSEIIAKLYLAYWGRRYFNRTGRMPTDEVFARMHNGGGWNGWKKRATEKYWIGVNAILSN